MGSSERICACMYMSVTIFQICLHMYKNMSWYLIPTTLSTLGYFLVFAPSISVDAFSSVFVYSPIARPIGSMYPILSTQGMPCALPDPFAATTVSCILVDMPLHGYSSTLCHGVLTFMDDWYFRQFHFLLCRNLPYTAGDLIPLFPTTSCRLFPVAVTMKITPTHFWILPLYWTCGPWTSSFSDIWELVRHLKGRLPPNLENQKLRFNKISGGLWIH